MPVFCAGRSARAAAEKPLLRLRAPRAALLLAATRVARRIKSAKGRHKSGKIVVIPKDGDLWGSRKVGGHDEWRVIAAVSW